MASTARQNTGSKKTAALHVVEAPTAHENTVLSWIDNAERNAKLAASHMYAATDDAESLRRCKAALLDALVDLDFARAELLGTQVEP